MRLPDPRRAEDGDERRRALAPGPSSNARRSASSSSVAADHRRGGSRRSIPAAPARSSSRRQPVARRPPAAPTGSAAIASRTRLLVASAMRISPIGAARPRRAATLEAPPIAGEANATPATTCAGVDADAHVDAARRSRSRDRRSARRPPRAARPPRAPLSAHRPRARAECRTRRRSRSRSTSGSTRRASRRRRQALAEAGEDGLERSRARSSGERVGVSMQSAKSTVTVFRVGCLVPSWGRGGAPHGLLRAGGSAHGQVERGVLVEDRLLEPLESSGSARSRARRRAASCVALYASSASAWRRDR